MEEERKSTNNESTVVTAEIRHVEGDNEFGVRILDALMAGIASITETTQQQKKTQADIKWTTQPENDRPQDAEEKRLQPGQNRQNPDEGLSLAQDVLVEPEGLHPQELLQPELDMQLELSQELRPKHQLKKEALKTPQQLNKEELKPEQQLEKEAQLQLMEGFQPELDIPQQLKERQLDTSQQFNNEELLPQQEILQHIKRELDTYSQQLKDKGLQPPQDTQQQLEKDELQPKQQLKEELELDGPKLQQDTPQDKGLLHLQLYRPQPTHQELCTGTQSVEDELSLMESDSVSEFTGDKEGSIEHDDISSISSTKSAENIPPRVDEDEEAKEPPLKRLKSESTTLDRTWLVSSQETPALQHVPSQETLALEHIPSQETPALEHVPSQETPALIDHIKTQAVEHVPSQEMPVLELVPSQEMPALEHVPSQETPALEHVPSQETPALEHVPSQEMPALEHIPSQETPALECEMPALEHVPSLETPALEPITPALEHVPSQALEHVLSQETSTLQHVPSQETLTFPLQGTPKTSDHISPLTLRDIISTQEEESTSDGYNTTLQALPLESAQEWHLVLNAPPCQSHAQPGTDRDDDDGDPPAGGSNACFILRPPSQPVIAGPLRPPSQPVIAGPLRPLSQPVIAGPLRPPSQPVIAGPLKPPQPVIAGPLKPPSQLPVIAGPDAPLDTPMMMMTMLGDIDQQVPEEACLKQYPIVDGQQHFYADLHLKETSTLKQTLEAMQTSEKENTVDQVMTSDPHFQGCFVQQRPLCTELQGKQRLVNLGKPRLRLGLSKRQKCRPLH